MNKLNKKLLVKRSKEMNYGPVQKTLFQRKMNKKGSIIVTLIFQTTINLKRSMTICSNYHHQAQKSKSINISNLQKTTNDSKSKKGKNSNNKISFHSNKSSKFIIKYRSHWF